MERTFRGVPAKSISQLAATLRRRRASLRDDRVIVVAPQRRLEYGRVTVTRVTVTPSGNLCYQLPHIYFTAPMTRIARSVVPGLPHHVT